MTTADHDHGDDVKVAGVGSDSESGDPEGLDPLAGTFSRTDGSKSSAAETTSKTTETDSTKSVDQDAQIALVPDRALKAVSTMISRNSFGASEGFEGSKVSSASPTKAYGDTAPPAVSNDSARKNEPDDQAVPPTAMAFETRPTTPALESDKKKTDVASKPEGSNGSKPDASLASKGENKKFEIPRVVELPKNNSPNDFAGNSFAAPMPSGRLRASIAPSSPFDAQSPDGKPPERLAQVPGAGPIAGSRGGYKSGAPKIDSRRFSAPGAQQDAASIANQLRRNASAAIENTNLTAAEQLKATCKPNWFDSRRRRKVVYRISRGRRQPRSANCQIETVSTLTHHLEN